MGKRTQAQMMTSWLSHPDESVSEPHVKQRRPKVLRLQLQMLEETLFCCLLPIV